MFMDQRLNIVKMAIDLQIDAIPTKIPAGLKLTNQFYNLCGNAKDLQWTN